jgi:hypothetical protein
MAQMPTAYESFREAEDLWNQGFREVIIAMEHAGDFIFVEYSPGTNTTRQVVATLAKTGKHTPVAIFGWGRNRLAQQVVRFRAAPGFRSEAHQTEIIFQYRYQQAMAEMKKEQERST